LAYLTTVVRKVFEIGTGQLMKAKPNRYQVNFTMKTFKGFEAKAFSSKAEADLWIKKNKKKLYWSQVVSLAPKSRLPRPIVLFDPEPTYEKFDGKLGTYFETGMECLALVFVKNEPVGPPNPNFDESKPEDGRNFKNYGNFDAIINLRSGQILKLPDGSKVGLISDAKFAVEDGHRLSFYPQGFTKLELVKLFLPETTTATIWVKKVT
jgi:hypothetical protein